MPTRKLNDWLENYLYLTRRSESPTQYHLWCGIAALGAALRRKCYLDMGLQGRRYPNFYIALVGPPGGRKGSAMSIAKPMVQALEIPMGSDALGSSQHLYKELERASNEYLTTDNKVVTHRSLSVWSEEFQVFLSGKDPMIMPSITDLFDSPTKWSYGSLQNEMQLTNCWLSIIGATTPQLLQSTLTKEAVGGGIVSRIIFVVGYGAIQRIAFPMLSTEDQQIKESLQKDLESIALLAGPFKMNESFINAYEHWYEQESATEGLKSDKFMGYNARRPGHLQKLCMIVSVSESSDMIITGKHFEKAKAILEETETEMPNAFHGATDNIYSEMYSGILAYVDSVRQFTMTDFLREHQLTAEPRRLEEALETLERVQRIKRVRSTSGKSYYEVLPEETEVRPQSSLLTRTLYKRIGRR